MRKTGSLREEAEKIRKLQERADGRQVVSVREFLPARKNGGGFGAG